MKAFYFQLGERFEALGRFRACILSGNPAFESAFHHKPSERRELFNGPIPCTLLSYPAPSDARPSPSHPRRAQAKRTPAA